MCVRIRVSVKGLDALAHLVGFSAKQGVGIEDIGYLSLKFLTKSEQKT